MPAPVDQDAGVEITWRDALFAGLPDRFLARVAHDEAVTTLHPLLTQLARSRLGEYEAIRHRDQPIYGLQFHPMHPEQPA